jgi:carbon monoxide dehydrogenase subunit G
VCALCRLSYRIASVLFLLLALLARGAAAATIAINVTSVADQIEIEASVLLNADTETAWRVLTDYPHYADFIPGLQCRVIARKGATVTVQQSGEVMLWLLHRPLDVTFEITEVAPTRLDSRVVAGDLRAFSSRYVLTPAGGRVRLDYSGTLDSGLGLFGPIERLAVRQNVTRRFQALADEIERRPGSAPGNAGLGSLDRN